MNLERKKMARSAILASAILGGVISFVQPYDAKAFVNYKKAKATGCYNTQGQLTGYGSTCEFGGATCTTNPC